VIDPIGVQMKDRAGDFIGEANSRATVSRNPEYPDEESRN
jgi:hypothetical protein